MRTDRNTGIPDDRGGHPSAIPAEYDRPPAPLPEGPLSLIGYTFAVLVTKDGGVAGGAAAECTYTYIVKALNDSTTLKKNTAGDDATEMTPEVPRLHYTEYWYAGETRAAPAVATSRYGLAAYDNGGDLRLLKCYGEIAKDTSCPDD